MRALLDVFGQRGPDGGAPRGLRALRRGAGGAMKGPARRRPYLLLLLAVVGLDQITKWLVDRVLDLHESRVLVDGLLSLTYVQNRGAAFGAFSDAELPHQSMLFSLVSLAA